MKFLLGLVFIVMVLSSMYLVFSYDFDKNKEKMEYAYMEGQKDYLNGDVRIEQDGQDFLWIKSPWDTERETSYLYLSDYK